MYKHLHGKKMQGIRELFQLAGKYVGRTEVETGNKAAVFKCLLELSWVS